MAEFVFRPAHELRRTPSKAPKPVQSPKLFIPKKTEVQTPIDEAAKTAETPTDLPKDGFGSFGSTNLEHLALKNLSNAARVRLSAYRREYGKQEAEVWLEHFSRAHAACVATFPEDRQSHALKNYDRRYCQGQAAQVIAAHTLALELWTVHRRHKTGTGYGRCLEAACKACGVDVATLPENKVAA